MRRRLVAAIAAAAVIAIVLAASATLWATGEPASGSEFVFDEVSNETGLRYTANSIAQYGNGRTSVYVSDYDRNGYPDVLALGGAPASGEAGPVLFQNSGGEFEPSGALPALGANTTVKAALFFDQDGDGWDDLLLFPLGGTPIYLENENGSYARRSAGFGDLRLPLPVSATAGDYNRDGCLDVFVVQNGHWARDVPQKEKLATGRSGSRRSVPPSDITVEEDNGNPNYLFRGDCTNGTFTDVTDEVGIGGMRWSTAASFVDFTGDGYPDIHVANDFNHDYRYVNRNGTSFDGHRISGTNRHGMASEVADFNRDGRMDVFVTNMQFRDPRAWTEKIMMSLDTAGNSVLINTGDGFASRGYEYDVRYGGWGWAAVATDFDNDGDRDLVHTTKFYTNISERTDRIRTYPKVWTRTGENFTALNASAQGFEPTNGRGLAGLDFDRDGDQDLVLANLDGEFKLYENRRAPGHWIQIAVEGDGDPAMGARVTVTTDERSIYLVNNARAGLQSQDTRVAHVGLGNAESVTIEVTWPDGTTRQFDDVAVDRRITLSPEEGIRDSERNQPLFRDAAVEREQLRGQ